MYAPTQGGRIIGLVRIPSWQAECAYYLTLVYSFVAPVVGLEIPALAGVMFLATTAICILQVRASVKAIYGPIGLLFACAVSFMFVQIAFHGESIMDSNIRAFIIWIFGLIIVQALCLRHGFYIRFPLFIFVLGACVLPFLEFNPQKTGVAQVDLGGASSFNAGALADWFGFCVVFFAVFGNESRKASVRIGAWLIAACCLLVVTFSIERGPLFATAVAVTVGLRRLLKRGFVPILALIILTGSIYVSGLFDAAISNYLERGMEETGREVLWPAAVDRIFSSPLVSLFGVGESNILFMLTAYKGSPPHNAFLHFALSSGIVPFAFFLAFWIQITWRSMHAKSQEADPFRIPYLIYVCTGMMLSDLSFMSPTGLFITSIAAGSAVIYGKQHLLVVRVGNKIRLGLFPRRKSPETGTIARSQS